MLPFPVCEGNGTLQVPRCPLQTLTKWTEFLGGECPQGLKAVSVGLWSHSHTLETATTAPYKHPSSIFFKKQQQTKIYYHQQSLPRSEILTHIWQEAQTYQHVYYLEPRVESHHIQRDKHLISIGSSFPELGHSPAEVPGSRKSSIKQSELLLQSSRRPHAHPQAPLFLRRTQQSSSGLPLKVSRNFVGFQNVGRSSC